MLKSLGKQRGRRRVRERELEVFNVGEIICGSVDNTMAERETPRGDA